MGKPTGFIVYEGASQLNGDDIVAILTLNSKTLKQVTWRRYGY